MFVSSSQPISISLLRYWWTKSAHASLVRIPRFPQFSATRQLTLAMRGIIINLIELYFLIYEEDSVHDALVLWSQTRVNQPRKYILVLMTISQWIETQDDWESHKKTLRRLGEEIVRLVRSSVPLTNYFQGESMIA